MVASKNIPLSRLVCGLFALLFSLMVGVSSAYAEGSDIDAVIDMGNDATVGAVVNQISHATDHSFLEYSSSDGILTFKNSEYYKLSSDERYEYMNTALGAVKDSNLSTMGRSKMFNFIADQDTATTAALRNLQTDANANVASATVMFKPFSGIVGTILGIITLLIFIFMTLSVVIDTAYIVLPPARMALETRSDGEKPPFITYAAHTSVKDAESGTEYRSAIGVYFRRRLVQFIVIGLCLLYLISGEIWGVVIFLIEAFRPLMDTISF